MADFIASNGLLIFFVIAGALVLWFISIYNFFVRTRERAKEAWADIDVQLKRRWDLIPNIVNTVKGYATHEREVFENVTKARTVAMGAQGDPQKISQAENMLAGTLKTLFAVSENYPDLKANANFLELQRELSDTENKIQAARRFYNNMVRDFNTGLQTFPKSLIAGMFRFVSMEYFDLEEDESAREPVKVDFSV